MKPTLIFEDENYIGYNKPSGLLSIPDRFNPDIPNLVSIARKAFEQVYVVHRLDKDTSGVICFAKNKEAHHYLSGCFAGHKVSKNYRALVMGTPAEAERTLSFPLQQDPVKKGHMMVHPKGKEAQTHYTVLKNWQQYSLLDVALLTGRTHQIRVHLSHIGHPIVCDPFYGDGRPFFLSSVKRKYKLSSSEEDERPVLSRLALHAYQLSFLDEAGRTVSMEAPLHKDMSVMIKLLERWNR